MTETELRELYIKAIDQAYECVMELSTLHRSAQLLRYLNRDEIRKVFKDRETGKLHEVLWRGTVCHIVIRTYAVCFDGGHKRTDLSPDEWRKLVGSDERNFSSVVAFFSHKHSDANFVKQLAARNSAFKKFVKSHKEELFALGLKGSVIPSCDEDVTTNLSELERALSAWRSIINDPRLKKLCILRSKYFAHKNHLSDDWFAKNDLKAEELISFVENTWVIASEILSLILYGVIKAGASKVEDDMNRLLLKLT